MAVENELDAVVARNCVRADGGQITTGAKTIQDAASFGAGATAATGLVCLPNTGAVKWRKADPSGGLGKSLNANGHIDFDAILDFAPGRTFGSFSYPDATAPSKGNVQIDAGQPHQGHRRCQGAPTSGAQMS